MLQYRIISGCFIGAGVLLAANFAPPVVVLLLLLAISSLAQYEFYQLMKRSGVPVFDVVGTVCGAGLIASTLLTIGPTVEDMAKAYRWEQLILLCSIVAIYVRQFPQKHNDQPLGTIACTVLGVLYVPYLFNFFTRLVYAWDGANVMSMDSVSSTGCRMVVYVVAVVKSTDVGAYFSGRRFGKHKLFPRISPGKTREGCVGGVLFAIVVSISLCAVMKGQLGVVSLSMGHAVVLGLLLSCAGIVGDLFESLLKRASGAKDSGRFVPGMGGLLDVLDSLLFGVPVLYVYARFFLS